MCIYVYACTHIYVCINILYVYIHAYKYTPCFNQTGLLGMPIDVVKVGTLGSVGIRDPFLTVLSPRLMAMGLLMPVMCYAYGYVLSALFKLSQA